MEVIFLGTGAGVPSKERNVSSLVLSMIEEYNAMWIFDCGEGTQHQMLHTSLKPRKINKIFITHLHGDHLFGLPGLLSSRSFLGGDDLLTIYGPPGIHEYVQMSLTLSDTRITYPLKIEQVKEGIVFEDAHFIVSCKKLDHRITSFGYRIEEKDKQGPLLVDKLQKAGIKPGPIYKEIKESDTVTLPNGQTLQTAPFIGPSKKGKTITILGDTRYHKEHEAFVLNSDLLIHEATFAQAKQDLALQYYHSTTIEAANLAKNSNVKKLILNHLSSRYQKEDLPQLLNEAQQIFPNTKLAHDFLHVTV